MEGYQKIPEEALNREPCLALTGGVRGTKPAEPVCGGQGFEVEVRALPSSGSECHLQAFGFWPSDSVGTTALTHRRNTNPELVPVVRVTQKDLDMIESLYEDERWDVGSPPRSSFRCGDAPIAERLLLMAGSVPRYRCCGWGGRDLWFQVLGVVRRVEGGGGGGSSGGKPPGLRVFWPVPDACGKAPARIELSRWKEMTWKNVGSECVRSPLMRCEVLVSAAERLPHLSLVAAL